MLARARSGRMRVLKCILVGGTETEFIPTSNRKKKALIGSKTHSSIPNTFLSSIRSPFNPKPPSIHEMF